MRHHPHPHQLTKLDRRVFLHHSEYSVAVLRVHAIQVGGGIAIFDMVSGPSDYYSDSRLIFLAPVSISPEPDAAAITPDLMPRIPAPAIVTSDEPSSNSTQPCTSSKATEDSNFFPQLPSLIIEESQIILPRYNRTCGPVSPRTHLLTVSISSGRRSSSRVPNGLPSPNPSDESAEEAVLLTTPPSIPRKRTPRVLVLATPEPTSDSSSEKAPVTRRRPRRSAPAVPSSSRVTRSRASIAAEAQREPSKARHPRVSAPPAAPVRRSARLAAAGRQASSVAEQPKKRSSTKRQRDEADTKGSNKKLRVC